MCKIVPVVVQGGAGEAECVGGPDEPGEHVWHRGESEEGVWAGSAVLWAHACIPEAVWDLRQVQQNQGTSSENTKIFRYAYLNKHLIYARSVCCWLIVGFFVPRRQRACIRRWWSASVSIRKYGSAMGPSCFSRVRVMLPVISCRGRWRVSLQKKVRGPV